MSEVEGKKRQKRGRIQTPCDVPDGDGPECPPKLGPTLRAQRRVDLAPTNSSAQCEMIKMSGSFCGPCGNCTCAPLFPLVEEAGFLECSHQMMKIKIKKGLGIKMAP
ncbi:hypothetical protein NPIL_7631 [Nephila pilipes]|nr:hypothetical protein NPIL_7631 [Nephila pilipes]